VAVVVVGLSQRTVPAGVLERMAVADEALSKALQRLREDGELAEAVVVSTCLRTEVYAVVERFHLAIARIRDWFAELGGVSAEAASDWLYAYYDEAAAAHLFEVAAGLDSIVLGETEVLGQVRRAWERARAEGACGPVLAALFRHAVTAGKRVRAETALGRGRASFADAAVALASRHVGELAGRRALVVGTGQMGSGLAAALAAAEADVVVASRSEERAEEVARTVGGRATDVDGLASLLGEVDVVFASSGVATTVLDAPDVEAALAHRRGRPLLIVDVAVPRDVDPDVAALPGVTVLDLEDLRSFASAARAGEHGELERARAILVEELDRYRTDAAGRSAAPLVAALRQRAEAIRTAELARRRAELERLDDEARATVEALTKAIVAKLLHAPTVRLKAEAGSPRAERLAEALRTLFEL
jgi:glutamyl-tRNA reductase